MAAMADITQQVKQSTSSIVDIETRMIALLKGIDAQNMNPALIYSYYVYWRLISIISEFEVWPKKTFFSIALPKKILQAF